ncbi:MAG: alpha-L-fucosidase [Phycisphaerae bacterium]|nr:alpha-L-fucosidase [Phycisphaerae bacterium]
MVHKAIGVLYLVTATPLAASAVIVTDSIAIGAMDPGEVSGDGRAIRPEPSPALPMSGAPLDRPGVGILFHISLSTFAGPPSADIPTHPTSFGPSALDVAQWVRTARSAGANRVLLTAKHHDGFCLWATSTTDHSVRNAADDRDLVAMLSHACAAEGMPFGIAFPLTDRRQAGDARYGELVIAQLRELCTAYGALCEIRFLGSDPELDASEQATANPSPPLDWQQVSSAVRDLQPAARITGDVPRLEGSGSLREEIVVPLRQHWFWRQSENEHVKDLHSLETVWYETVGIGKDLLLVVPPDNRGLIPAPDRTRLASFRAQLDATFVAGQVAGQAGASRDGNRQISLTFDSPRTINRLTIELDGAAAQGLSLAARLGKEWSIIPFDGTVQDQRTLRFAAVTADEIRLHVPATADLPGSVSVMAFCAPPEVRIVTPLGAFSGIAEITLTSDLPDTEIRYTLDGRTPTRDSLRYAGPFVVSTSSRVRAIGFRGRAASLRIATVDVIRAGDADLRPAIQFIRAPEPGLRLRRHDRAFESLDALAAAKPDDPDAFHSIIDSIQLPRDRPSQHYGLLLDGFMNVPADGIYTFTMRSDDASRLYIHDMLVVDHGDGASWEWWQGRIPLRAGWHPIRIEFLQADGEDRLQLRCEGPGLDGGSIPSSALGH